MSAMAEAAISSSSGYAVQIRRIRDRWHPVKSRTEHYERPEQDTPSQSFAARLSFFTSRHWALPLPPWRRFRLAISMPQSTADGGEGVACEALHFVVDRAD